jgi:hypothetical protein
MILLVFKKGYESDVGPGGEGVKSAPRPKKCPSIQKVPLDPKSAPDPKINHRPKKCPPTQKIPLDPKSAQKKLRPEVSRNPKSVPDSKIALDPKI